MGFFSGKKILALGVIVVLLAVIPFAVYFLQKEQETRSRAAKSTTLFLLPATVDKIVGEQFNLDVMVDPGTNIITDINLSLIYDQEKISTDAAEVGCGTSFCQTGVIPVSSLKYEHGKISVSLKTSPGAPSSIQTQTKIATVTFKALAPTTISPTQIGFGTGTNVQATLENAPELDVLSTTKPAVINITSSAELTPSPTPTSTPPASVQNQSPICDSLNVDRVTSGTAPFSITFTANGRDLDGTISKITFDFGDGPIQDITQANGIGSNSVSAQIAHTYQNPGTYKVSVILTDDNSATSDPATCTQTITVAQEQTDLVTQVQSPLMMDQNKADVETPTPTLVAQAPITPPGPSDKIMTIGIAGVVLSILGALLFFAL